MMKRLLILGAGGFGQMIKETAGLLGMMRCFFWTMRQKLQMLSENAVTM